MNLTEEMDFNRNIACFNKGILTIISYIVLSYLVPTDGSWKGDEERFRTT